MTSSRKRFNSKRRIMDPPPSECDLESLEKSVSYGGNPAHKRNPGDFGLTPPAQPRDHKSLCDNVQIFRRDDALELLRKGIKKGMISDWDGEGFPKNIWSMTKDGIPLEAQLENPGNGTYHGYPLEENDDFRKVVIDTWQKRS
jgi:hypothetical protein